MDDATIKYLEFLQNVIKRMSDNLVHTHTWCLTLLAAIWAFIYKGTLPFLPCLLSTSIVIIIFWGLAGFYLRYERIFRKMYDKVVAENHKSPISDITYTLFEMTPKKEDRDAVPCVFCMMFSKTLSWLYLLLIGTNVLLVLVVCKITIPFID